jgi:kinesin family protein 13
MLGIFVDGLSKHPVASYEEIKKVMDTGESNRTLGATQMNATSSRAHTVIQIEFKNITMADGKKKS